MKRTIIAVVLGVIIGAAVSSFAQVSVDRSRMENVRAQAKVLALKVKNGTDTAADRQNLLVALSYIVLMED